MVFFILIMTNKDPPPYESIAVIVGKKKKPSADFLSLGSHCHHFSTFFFIILSLPSLFFSFVHFVWRVKTIKGVVCLFVEFQWISFIHQSYCQMPKCCFLSLTFSRSLFSLIFLCYSQTPPLQAGVGIPIFCSTFPSSFTVVHYGLSTNKKCKHICL